MNITAETFAAYLRCPMKSFLRAHGETGAGNEYADWARTEGAAYRLAGINRLTAGIPPGEWVTGAIAMDCIKAARWRVAADVKACARNLECSIHAVERIPAERIEETFLEETRCPS